MYDYPESQAVKQWEKDGVSFSLIQADNALSRKHYCGYCRFSERPVIEQGYDGILAYVPVHGYITYAEQDKDGSMVYGFDCAHSGDDSRSELHNLNWLTAECEKMAEAIRSAALIEEEYLQSETEEEKETIVYSYHESWEKQGAGSMLADIFTMLDGLRGSL